MDTEKRKSSRSYKIWCDNQPQVREFFLILARAGLWNNSQAIGYADQYIAPIGFFSYIGDAYCQVCRDLDTFKIIEVENLLIGDIEGVYFPELIFPTIADAQPIFEEVWI